MLNIGGWVSLHGEEASGALSTAPSGLRATLHIPPVRLPSKRLWFLYHIIPSPSSASTLLPLSLRLQFFCPHILLPHLHCCISHHYPQDNQAVCSHHLLDRRIPGFRSTARHKSMIGWVAMYWVKVFWWREIYTPISSSATIASATPMGGYTHVPSHLRLGPMPVRHWIWVMWNRNEHISTNIHK